MDYTIKYTKEKDWGYTTQVLELPWCISYWIDKKDAQEMTKEAIKAYLESIKKHNVQRDKTSKKHRTFNDN
jgi:predicted RNase H-like HicB family nuclease